MNIRDRKIERFLAFAKDFRATCSRLPRQYVKEVREVSDRLTVLIDTIEQNLEEHHEGAE